MDDRVKLTSIFQALGGIAESRKVVLTLHPRTIIKLEGFNIVPDRNIQLLESIGYFKIIWLLSHCQTLLTDSSGLQNEAFFCKKSCVTARDETEWVKLVLNGVNFLTGHSKDRIIAAYNGIIKSDIEFSKELYGKGNSGSFIVERLVGHSTSTN